MKKLLLLIVFGIAAMCFAQEKLDALGSIAQGTMVFIRPDLH
jgi:hypothetical protein